MQETWIAPINPKFFDIRNHCLSTKEVAFKRSKRVNVGDIVFIYIASPESQIAYKGVVINDLCLSDDLIGHDYVKNIKNDLQYNYFIVRIEKEYQQGTFPIKLLRDKGIGQVQVLSRANRQIKQFLDENA